MIQIDTITTHNGCVAWRCPCGELLMLDYRIASALAEQSSGLMCLECRQRSLPTQDSLLQWFCMNRDCR